MDEKLTQVYLTGPEPILEKFSKFKNKICRKLSLNTFGLITELGELIKLSKLFMDYKKYKEAQYCYDEIIEQHPDFSDIAHYYKAFCIIHLEGGDKEEKLKAKAHLKKALSLLESKRSTIMSRLNVNYFKKQNEDEAQILSHHNNAILEAIGSEVGSENFRNGKITGDIPTEVYKELLKDDYDMIKDNRINTIFGENISQIQEIIQASLSGKERFSLSPGDIIKKTTLINTLKEFGHDRQMSEEQISNILRYLEFNETLRIDKSLEEKFNDNTNNRVFCGKKEKIKKFLLGKESYTLTSGEKVSLQPGESKVSINQLIAVMEKIGITDNEKINDLFNYLALEVYSLKFINSYKEFYLENNNIQKIKEYLSKISFILTDENKNV
ncbi:unnamed protein product [Rotaria sp. Silwood2]|nr:unnamed protein product [Rotaria sp. Silwood2]